MFTTMITVCINLLHKGRVVVEMNGGNPSGRSISADNQANTAAPPHQEHFIGNLPSFCFSLRRPSHVSGLSQTLGK